MAQVERQRHGHVLFFFVLFSLVSSSLSFSSLLFCFVLFCFVLFCFVLFCFVLFCFCFVFVLFCFVLLKPLGQIFTGPLPEIALLLLWWLLPVTLFICVPSLSFLFTLSHMLAQENKIFAT